MMWYGKNTDIKMHTDTRTQKHTGRLSLGFSLPIPLNFLEDKAEDTSCHRSIELESKLRSIFTFHQSHSAPFLPSQHN